MLFLLNQKDELISILSNDSPRACPYYEDAHVENVTTGVHYYDFSVPATHETASKLSNENSVILKDLDGKFQQFKIKDVGETGTSNGYFKNIKTEHVAISELLTDVVRPVFLKSVTLEVAMDHVLNDSEYELGDYDFIGSIDLEIKEHVTVLEAIYKIMELFAAEIQFEVIFVRGKILKKLVHLQKQRGTVTKKLFTYSTDLADVERHEDTKGLVTALIAVGKAGTDGKPLNLIGYARTASGLHTDAEKDYVESPADLDLYGKNGKHIFGVHNDSNAKTQVELFESTKKELQIRRKSIKTYKCTVVTLERITGYSAHKVRVGDTIVIQDHSFNPPLLLEARILEVTRSYTDSEKDEVVLGDYRLLKITSTQSLERLKTKIAQREDYWEQTTYKAEIYTSAGDVLKNGIGTTELTARLFQSTSELDSAGSIYTYKWYKSDKDGVPDENFGGVGINFKTGKKLVVSGTDVDVKAIFTVEIS